MRVNVVVVVIRIGIVVKDFEQMILNKSQCSFARLADTDLIGRKTIQMR